MKPMLASDYVESKLRFPVMVQPKVDGVRGVCFDGKFTGRSLKAHKNRFVTRMFSMEELSGLDGEIAAAKETDSSLCRITTSRLGTIDGEPYVVWWLFDYITPYTAEMTYQRRYDELRMCVATLQGLGSPIFDRLRVMPSTMCYDLESLRALDAAYLSKGFEGTIIRDPNGLYKEGRSTVKEMGLLRIKGFADFEVLVTRIFEGNSNTNEAKINELGNTSRSTHQENMVPNGMVGSMLGVVLADVKDSEGNILFAKGRSIEFAAGCMTHAERARYFQNPTELIGQVAKVKTFLKGVKDKPRFPTFQTLRIGSDIS